MDDMDRAGVLRALRAWVGLEQEVVAAVAGISLRTLTTAESGALCSDKSWGKLLAVYGARGLTIDDDGLVLRRCPTA